MIALTHTLGAEAGNLARLDEVRDILLRIKLAVTNDRTWRFLDREKNLASMSRLGLIRMDVATILKQLQPEDYVEGPLADERGRSFIWWVFGPNHAGKQLYVKVGFNDRNVLYCMSLHEAEYPLHLPLRTSGGSGS